MAYDTNLADRIRHNLRRRKGIKEKEMFGGVGFLLNGNILVGVWKQSLIARIGPDNYEEALLTPHVREFDITGKAMKGWVLVDSGGLLSDEDLHHWMQMATRFVAKLPAK